MSADDDLREAAQEVARALADGREMWDQEPFDWPWYVGPMIPGCDCDITYHDAQNVTLGLRLNCPSHGKLAVAMSEAWTPDWQTEE